MSIFHDSALIGSGGGAVAYQINQSLRFNSSDSTYLNRTPGSTSGETQWTCSLWVKFAQSQNTQYLFWAQSGSNYTTCEIGSGQINFTQVNGGSVVSRKVTSQLFRDFSAWYHLVIVWDSANATASERVRLYVNGSRITAFATDSNPPQNHQSSWNQSGYSHTIGKISSGSTYFDGYIAEFNHVSGQALTAASFGETDAITGAWIPKKYSGSYGTNGFYLKFDPSATNGIGHDHSGNGNNFTATGFSTSGTGTDVMSDTPTNNYATLNPLLNPYQGSPGFYDGNLGYQLSSGGSTISTIGVSSGKWYAEIKVTNNVVNRPVVGINYLPDPYSSTNGSVWPGDGVAYAYNGVKWVHYSSSAYGSSWANGDIIGIALDLDSGTQTVTFYRNGTSQGAINLPASDKTWHISMGSYGADGNTYYIANFGQRAFEQTQPSGFKAWNTANLPEPTIKKGSKYFDTKLYTGNSTGGAATQTLTGFGFSPDFVWIKGRASSTANHSLFDQVRGTGKVLWSQSTNQEETNYSRGYLSAFTSDGFTVTTGSTDGRDVNGLSTGSPPDTYVAWAWDANGAGSSNTAGTITSTVSANATAGFSIVTYTGAGSNGTVGHGLGVAPKFLIVKNRSSATAYNWYVWHTGLTSASYFLNLNRDIAQTFSADPFNGTAPTSTVFSVGGENRVSSVNYVAYCFSEVAGYSKFGSYTGNGSSDGPFVFCGFRPRWVMIKVYSGTTDSWFIYDAVRDSYNLAYKYLRADLSNSENTDTTNASIDILSNGFKLRHIGANTNGNGNGYIFAAFAEHPFKYSNAR